jgi:hypothetical protein
MEAVNKMENNDIPSSDMLPDFFLLSASFSPAKEGFKLITLQPRVHCTYEQLTLSFHNTYTNSRCLFDNINYITLPK